MVALEAPYESIKKLPVAGRAKLNKINYTIRNGVYLRFSAVYI